MIRVLIVDDEPLARDTLGLTLSEDPEIEIVGACSGVDAAALVESMSPDIMFLDVQMPDVDGFSLIQEIGPGTVPVVVFVTAYDRYALRAFEVHALDYLLKPFDDHRFRDCLARAKENLRSQRAGSLEKRLLALLEEREQSTRAAMRRFVVRERARTRFLSASAVDWIEAADDYVELHVGGDSHLVRDRISALEQRLDPALFVRIHRSTIVNIERVREMEPLFRGDCIVTLNDGTRLRLARSRRNEFERRLSSSPHRESVSPQNP